MVLWCNSYFSAYFRDNSRATDQCRWTVPSRPLTRRSRNWRNTTDAWASKYPRPFSYTEKKTNVRSLILLCKQRRPDHNPVGVVRKAAGRPRDGFPDYRNHFTERQTLLLSGILFVFVFGEHRFSNLYVCYARQGEGRFVNYKFVSWVKLF